MNKILHFADVLAILIKSVTDGTCWSFRNYEFHHKNSRFLRDSRRKISHHIEGYFLLQIYPKTLLIGYLF